MEEQEITKEKLKNKIGISSATMAKLSKNEDVSMSTIQSEIILLSISKH